MPSDKQNLRTAKPAGLMIIVASSQDVPFHQPQQVQCLHHGATFEPLCVPVFSSQLRIGDNLR